MSSTVLSDKQFTQLFAITASEKKMVLNDDTIQIGNKFFDGDGKLQLSVWLFVLVRADPPPLVGCL